MNDIEKASTQKDRIAALEAEVAQLKVMIERIAGAVVDSAHVMGWPRDLLESHGLKAFDKTKDVLKIRQ